MPTVVDIVKRVAGNKSISPAYQYKGEVGINPAFQDTQNYHGGKLSSNEKRIWVLRSDRILATGIKHLEDGATNRYGHPSLTVKSENYDGKAINAGWIAQRIDHLQIFLSSGRFNDENSIDPLNAFERRCLEIYIAKQFMAAYGEQDVVFVDFNEKELKGQVKLGEGLGKFLDNDPAFGEGYIKRIYTPAFVNQASELAHVTTPVLDSLEKSLIKLLPTQKGKIKRGQVAPAPEVKTDSGAMAISTHRHIQHQFRQGAMAVAALTPVLEQKPSQTIISTPPAAVITSSRSRSGSIAHFFSGLFSRSKSRSNSVIQTIHIASGTPPQATGMVFASAGAGA